MKCPNCGGEVSVNDIKCPYCGTPNPEGIQFQAEVHERRSFNEYLRNKIKEQMRLPLMQRILNLSIFFLLLIFIIQIFISVGIYVLAEGNVLAGLRRPEDYELQMAQMYEEGSYGELRSFMEQYGVDGTDYPKYMQMCLLAFDYQEYLFHSMSCTEALEQGILPDDYHFRYAIDTAKELLNPHIPAYPVIYPENQPVLEAWQEEITVQLAGMFSLTEEEILTLAPGPDGAYDYKSDEVEALWKKAEERLKKEGYQNETDR